MTESERRPWIGVGAIVWRGDEVVLIRRSKPPFKGQWSIPGGGQQWGETARAGALRELKEETGLVGEILGLVDVVDAIHSEGDISFHSTLIDFAVRIAGGQLHAGDDAAEAAWHKDAALDGLGLWDETLRVIRAARRFFD